MSNTHPAVAKFRQEGTHDWQSEEGSTDATNIAAILDAQVEATLALAYEQRTANLIAFLQPVKTGEDTVVYAHTESALKSLTEIAARLGVQPDGSVVK